MACMAFRNNPLRANVSADDRPNLQTFSKHFSNSNFNFHFWIQHEKCIQMSTNKPSIWSVVSEKASDFEKLL